MPSVDIQQSGDKRKLLVLVLMAIGNLELLQDDFGKDTEPYLEIKNILKNLNLLKKLIKRISQLEKVVTRDYDGTSRIVDLDKSSPPAT